MKENPSVPIPPLSYDKEWARHRLGICDKEICKHCKYKYKPRKKRSQSDGRPKET